MYTTVCVKTATNDRVKDFCHPWLGESEQSEVGWRSLRAKAPKASPTMKLRARIIAFWNNGISLRHEGSRNAHRQPHQAFDPMPIWRGPKDDNRGSRARRARRPFARGSRKSTSPRYSPRHASKKDEAPITGEEKLARHIVASHPPRCKSLATSPLGRKRSGDTRMVVQTTFGITWLELPGTVLRGDTRRTGTSCFSTVSATTGGTRFYHWLGGVRGATCPSAVLAS